MPSKVIGLEDFDKATSRRVTLYSYKLNTILKRNRLSKKPHTSRSHLTETTILNIR